MHSTIKAQNSALTFSSRFVLSCPLLAYIDETTASSIYHRKQHTAGATIISNRYRYRWHTYMHWIHIDKYILQPRTKFISIRRIILPSTPAARNILSKHMKLCWPLLPSFTHIAPTNIEHSTIWHTFFYTTYRKIALFRYITMPPGDLAFR